MTLGTPPYHEGAVSTDAPSGPEAALTRNIHAHFAGPVTGQLVIGDGNILIDRSPGAYVKVTNAPPPRPRLRQRPVKLQPRDFPELLGRESELDRASKALMASQAVEFHASRGWGKSVLLRHLSCHPPGGLATDGLVFLDAGGLLPGDLSQILFDVFYETDVPFKPSPGQLRQYLAGTHALLSLDDLSLDPAQLTALSNAVPQCLLLVASEARTLWGEGDAIALHGLPEGAALALFERELGRPLTADERPHAVNLCRRVAGQPLAVLQTAALARERRLGRSQLISLLAPAADDRDIASRLVGYLSPPERAVVGFLASQEGTAVAHEQIARFTRIGDIDPVLESLGGMGLAQPTASGWRFSGILSPALGTQLDTGAWAAAAINEVTAWVEEQQGDPARVVAEQELVLRTASQAQRSKSWRQLQRLARGASSAFLLSGLWDAWAAVLQAGLTAAQQLHDRSAVAWFLHQLGTRALCLHDPSSAGELLRQALTIRRSLGDGEGAAVTQHNLELIAGAPPPWWASAKVVGGGLAALLAIVGAGFGIALATGHSQPHPVVISASPTATLSQSGVPGISPTSLNFGSVAVGSFETRQLVVSNPSPVSMPLGPVTAGRDFQEADHCPQLLDGHGSCSIDVTFHPTAARTSHAILSLSYGSGSQRTVPLTGAGVVPQLSLDPASADFKSQKVGRTSAAITVKLRNAGKLLATINNVGIDGDFGVGGPCARGPAQLAPGQECALAVTFNPTARGDRRGQLLVQGDRVKTSAQLSGFGVAPDPRFDPTALDFGNQIVGLPGKTITVAVKNAGDASLDSAKMVVTDDFSATDCQQSVAPGASCEIRITFLPRSRGLHAGTVQMVDNDAGKVGKPMSLKGNGLAPLVSFRPSPADFTKVYDTKLPVTVTNVGDAPLMIQSIAIGGRDWDHFYGDSTCGSGPIPPAGDCTVNVHYQVPPNPPPPNPAPTPRMPPYKASLVLTDNAQGGTQQVEIIGPPLAPQIG